MNQEELSPIARRAYERAKQRQAESQQEPKPDHQGSYFNSGSDSSAFRTITDVPAQLVTEAAGTTFGDVVYGAGNLWNAAARRIDSALGLKPPEEGSAAAMANQAMPGNLLRTIGQKNREGADAIGDFLISEQGQRARDEAMPDGDILRTDTWTAGENPTLRGQLMVLAQTLGSYAPELTAARLATLNRAKTSGLMASTGTASGLSAAGGVSRGEAERIEAMSHDELSEASQMYNDLLAEGASPEQAKQRVSREAEEVSAMVGGAVGGAGGAALGYIIGPARNAVARHIASPTARATTLGAAGAASEVAHEVGTSVSSKVASAQAIGEDEREITEGTFGDAVLGGAAGGVIGAGSGAAGPQSPPPEEQVAEALRNRQITEEQAQEILALPAPEQLLALENHQGRYAIEDQSIIYGEAPDTSAVTEANRQAFEEPYQGPRKSRKAGQPKPEAEQPALRAAKGRQDSAWTPDNQEIPVNYALVELDDLNVSHDEGGRANPNYPQELQQRERENVASQAWIARTASQLNPARLSESPNVGDGAPIIGPDGVVESGNGRTAAIRLAYRQNTPQAQQYREHMQRKARELGIPAEQVAGMRNPVLVRMREGETTGRQQFTRQANQQQVSSQNRLEQARTDAEKIDSGMMQSWNPSQTDGPLAASNQDFVRAFASQLGPEESAGLMRNDGTANKEMGRRIEAAVFHKAYQNDRLTDMQTEMDGPYKNLVRALSQSASNFAMARELNPEMAGQMADTIGQAVEIAESARRNNQTVVEYLSQQDAFADATPEEVAALAKFIATNRSKPTRLSAMFTELGQILANQAQQTTNENLFGDQPLTQQEMINEAQGRTERTDEAGTEPGPRTREPDREQGRETDTPTQSLATVTEAPEQTQQVDEFDLQTQTQQELEQQEQQRLQQQQEEAEAERQRQQREQADREADDFALAGSDSFVDQAEARGQNNLFDEAAQEVDTSPTEAQKEAGNYKKGHASFQGLNITIENPKGSTRSGTDPDGNTWETEMAHHYGYIKQTEGADGDHVDVFIGENEQSQQVFVVDQINPDGTFDEHKVMLGFNNQQQAQEGYLANYEDNWQMGPITETTLDDFKAWLETGNTRQPFAQEAETQQEPQTETSEPAQPAAPIEDAGEKLGGARKDEMRSVRERLEGMDDAEIASSTLSKLWPKKEIDNIKDNAAAAIYKTARDIIPNKPRRPHLVKRWVEDVKLARQLVSITEERGGETVLQKMHGNWKLLPFLRKIKVLTELPRDQWDRIGRVESVSGKYKQGGDWVEGSWFVVEIDKRRQHFYGHEKTETVIPEIKAALEEKQPTASKMKFEIRQNKRSGEVFINKAGDKERRRLKTFESVNEARAFMNNNHDQLVEAWEAVKNRDNVTRGDMRTGENLPRTGKDHREGKNITSEEFVQAFGFRGVEFGNWVKQTGKHASERQDMLNDTYDAFMDLADILNIPPEAISLNGRLGVGLGSRGKGKANAHFEPDRHVINLTKTKGAGALAHEWFHALDNHFARQRGEPEFTGDQQAFKEQAFVTYRPEPMMVHKKSYEAGRNYRITKADFERRKKGLGYKDSDWMPDPDHPQGIRPEIEQAFSDLVNLLDESPMLRRSRAIDGSSKRGYWSDIIERGARAFETYVIAQMANQGFRNDFLANVVPVEEFARNPERYPYLTEAEQQPVNRAFDKLFNTLEARETDQGTQLYSLGPQPATGTQADEVRSYMKDKLGKVADRVKVVQSVDDLPARVRLLNLANGVPDSEVQGVWSEGKIYAVADNLDDLDGAVRTALHEVVGHEGIKGLLGDRLDTVMQQIYSSFHGSPAMQQLRETYTHLDARTKEGKNILAQELVAHLAENSHRKPNLWRKFVSALRNALRQVFPQIQWKGWDIYALIDQARKHVERADAKAANAADNETLYKRRTTAEAFTDLSGKQADFLSKIGQPTLRQKAGEWLAQTFDRARLRFRNAAVDQYAALQELDRKLNGEGAFDENIQSSSWVLARLASGAGGVVQTMMEMGRVYWDGKNKVIDVQEDTVGNGGLTGVLYQLGESAEIERFMGWIAANRSDKLAKEGRENLFDADEIAAGIQLNEGTTKHGKDRKALYNKVFKEFQQYRDDVLQIAEESGIITEENRAMWRDEFYVPFYRVQQEMDAEVKGPRPKKGITRQEAYKRLKGGDQNLNDLLQNTLLNFHHLVESSLKNVAATQAIDNAQELGIAEPVKESSRDPKTSTFILRNGQKDWYQINDPLLFNSLTAMTDPGINFPGMGALRKFKRLFTTAITATPQFQFSILMRDSMQAIATSKMPYNVPKNIIKGAIAYGVDSKTSLTRARMMATGGSMNFGHIFGSDPDAAKASLDMQLRNANLLNKDTAFKAGRAAWNKWMQVTNTAENINRATIFNHSYEQNKLKAAFEARDLIDYAQRGSHPLVRFFIDVVPFMNARIQGLDKLYRTGFKPTAKVIRSTFGGPTAEASDKAAAKRFSMVTAAISLATVALYLNNKDNEEYEKLEDWDRDTYWHFFLDGKHFRLHKPFEVGAIATLTERITQQFVDEKATGKLFAERLGHMLGYTFALDPTPQAINPLIEVYSNRDKFTGRNIESIGMQRLSPSQRSRDNTTKLAEWASMGLESTAGQVFGKDSSLVLSPVQIDHLISGYFGQIGQSVGATADVILRRALGESQPEKRWFEYQPIRRFYRETDIPGFERYGTVFYDRLREVRRTYADIQNYRSIGEMERARELAMRSRDELAQRQVMERASRQVNALRARSKLIRNNHELGAAEKRAELDRIRAMQNRLMRQVVERLEL